MISGLSRFSYLPKAALETAKTAAIDSPLFFIAKNVFNTGTNIGLVGYGLKEVILDSHPGWLRLTPKKSLPPAIRKTMQVADKLLMMVRQHPATPWDQARFTAHGLLMVGAGVAGTAYSLLVLGGVSYNPALRFFSFTTNILFIFGNLIYLEDAIRKFVVSAIKLKNGTEDKKPLILSLTASAAGITSTLSYTAASVAILGGAPFVYSLLFGLVGLFAGGLRILLESYIAWKKQTAKA